MNHSRYLTDGHYSPYPVKRRNNGNRKMEMDAYQPAITILPPDPYMLVTMPEVPRPISPGVYKTAPAKTARNKKSSFVILGETISTPVQSRPASPSGRVSPFRGHGFKSPNTSRPNSRSVSPAGSPSKKNLPKPAIKKAPTGDKSARFNHDIGLPPKSPKKVIKPSLAEYKPASPKRLAPKVEKTKSILKKPQKSPVPPKKIGLKPILKPYVPMLRKDTKNSIGNTSVKKDEKKPEVPKAQPSVPETKPTESKSEEKKTENKETKPSEEIKKEEPKERSIPCLQPDKCMIATPTMASPSQTTTPTISTASTLNSLKNSEVAATATAVAAPTAVTSSHLSARAISSAMALSGNLKRRQMELEKMKLMKEGEPTSVEKVTVTTTTTETVQVVQHVGSASSIKSIIDAPSSACSSMTTVRAASNGSLQSKPDVPGETISTTKLITSDPDMEVLSPNNLLNSPPRRPPMAWDEERIPNGDVPSNGIRRSRLRRFFDAFLRLLGFIFCCRCSPCCSRIKCSDKFQCCKKIKCCPKSKCCKRTEVEPPNEPPPPRVNCCTRCRDRCKDKCCKCNACRSCCNKFLNIFNCFKCCSCSKCCKSDKSCCKKLKCCEGSKCCKRKQKTTTDKSTKCCAKMSCDCKTCCRNCCDKMKNCCLDCGEGINRCCRSLFCLNFLCCQRCLKKCRCCHKFKCCQKGGCCSCFNPFVKPDQKRRNAKLAAKKLSHGSSVSKSEEKKLDQALVEHASVMKAAIPVLPTCLAVLCLLLNLFLPGCGTLFSGIFCLCFGKARFSVKDTPQNRLGSFCVNIVIAIAQLFTVIFCLVGWGWSIWWGVIMYKLARKQKRLKLAEKNQQQEGGSSNVNQNHVDVEQG